MGVFAFSWTMTVLGGLLEDYSAKLGNNSSYDDPLCHWLVYNRRF